MFTHGAGVTPFVLEDAAQFRPEPPPDVTSPEYAAAIAEVRDLGRDSSSTRTADQTVAARFWSAPIWNCWNEIAQGTSLSHHLGLVGTARLFADLNLALADGVIALYDAKYVLARYFVHTRIDHEAGLRLGRRVAALVVDHASPG